MSMSRIDIYRLNLPRRAILVYLYLDDRANSKRECWPSLNTIARDLRISRMTASRGINDLIENKLIVKEKRRRVNGGNTSNLYTIKEIKSCLE